MTKDLSLPRLLLVLCLAIPVLVHAATPAQIDAARNAGLGWLINAQSGDGDWMPPGGATLPATSAAASALQNAGVTGYPYTRAIAWLMNADPRSIDGLGRQALALSAAGVDTTARMQQLLALRNDRVPAWGAYPGYGASYPDTALVLDAILATGTAYADTGTTLGFVVFNQNVDGGWPWAPDTVATPQSRLLPTAFNLLTLTAHRDIGWGVQAYITAGCNWLLARQKPDGSFGDDANGTVVETALALQAINAEYGPAHAAALAAQDFLIAGQAPDGSWNGDALQTALALQTLPATTLADTDGDGVPDDVELLLGTNPAQFDSRYLAGGNGNGISGVHLPAVIATTDAFSPFSHTLADTGGTGPFTWTLVAGSLPPGISLDSATGQLSGVPAAAGAYSFLYTVTDGGGQTLTVVVQIVVAAPAFVPDGDLNGDGNVNVADVLLAQRILTGDLTATPEQQIRGDVAPLAGGVPAPDGAFTAGDVLLIQQKALGLISF